MWGSLSTQVPIARSTSKDSRSRPSLSLPDRRASQSLSNGSESIPQRTSSISRSSLSRNSSDVTKSSPALAKPGSSAQAPSSSLRQEMVMPTSAAQSLQILAEILNVDSTVLEERCQKGMHSEYMRSCAKGIDFRGMSLNAFAQQAGCAEGHTQADPALESASTISGLNDLHKSIKECDDVLRTVEASLSEFQQDLGTVSTEIETLQNRSEALNAKLENRKKVEKILGPAVEAISIAPTVVSKLSRGAIDPDWAAALQVLDAWAAKVQSEMKDGTQMRVMQDLEPLLSNLQNLVIGRIRDYLVSQIKALRSPNVNSHNIQQQSIMPYSGLFAYLHKHHASLANQILLAYSNTMRWYYLSNFSRYRQALTKMPLHSIDRADALGQHPVSSGSPALSQSKATNPLSLGRRIDEFVRPSTSAMTSYAAQESQIAYIEKPFNAFTIAITDNVSAEYAFLLAFLPPGIPSSIMTRTFQHIFAPTFELAQTFVKTLVEKTYDCLGLLLCIRLMQHHAFTLQRRKCPTAEGWINGTTMLLWPRFQIGMDAHVEGVKRATASISSGSTRATLTLTASKHEAPLQNSGTSIAPHPLTQQFGQILQGILALSNNDPTSAGASTNIAVHDVAAVSSDTEPVGNSLERLRGEVENFLQVYARSMPLARRNRFLNNNYSLILTIVGDTGGTLAQDQRQWLEKKIQETDT